MAKDPQAVLQAYQSGVSGGSGKYTAGVRAAATDWEQQAKSDASEQRYAAGVQRAATQKTRQKALQNVSGAQWAAAAADVGASQYAASASRAATNYNAQLSDILTAGDAAKAAARSIAGATMADRLQRSVAAATAVHRHWARKRGIQPEV